ncbi:protein DETOXIFICATION 13 [Ziziphus jujuba]|nr:protein DETOXIFICATION 13-like [Ziziphus jujuba]XP_060668249.1 protein DETOXIFICATION 13-like [Ziziphus jujuba]XP_060668250.1 protein DETOXIFICATION 13-like [Ziziphus jujuba]XP_060675745.1 protein DETOXIFICATION 13 [Ziziphus jujuba]
MFLAVAETSIVSTTLFFTRRIFGYTFSNEKEVVDYVTKMAPLVCLNAIFDSLQGVLSGVARGCGWQHIGAYINLSAFYLCGIPVAAILGFWFQLRGEGLWIGIQLGSFMQTVLLSLVTISTDWEKQVYIYIPYLLVQTGRNNEKRKKKANSQIQEEEHRA